MILARLSLLSLLLVVLNACVTHTLVTADFIPKDTFSGRLLVMGSSKRFQVEIDWKTHGNQGQMRLTHASSGRVVDVVWRDEDMLWRDGGQHAWQPLSEEDLSDMGVILPPWVLADIFRGEMPKTMKTKDGQTWQGKWYDIALKVRWSEGQHKLELQDIKHGRRVVVIFND